MQYAIKLIGTKPGCSGYIAAVSKYGYTIGAAAERRQWKTYAGAQGAYLTIASIIGSKVVAATLEIVQVSV